jgi:2-methylcitrate dehydratase PrpD
MAGFDPDLGNSVFFERGLHATSICGTVGAAAGASLLAGVGTEVAAHAMAIAASMGAGLLEANRTGGSVKRTHCGWAAHAGVMAARMALAGVTGPPTVLEGRFGFYAALTGGLVNESALVGDLGKRWEAANLFIKPYPANHFTHAGIDSALALIADGLVVDDVTGIELGLPEPVLRTIAEPPDVKARPESAYHARFSGPFTVAAALATGRPDLAEHLMGNPRVLELASIVRCVADEEATRAFPHQFPAVLRVHLVDGSMREHRVHHTRGGPQHPLARRELLTKFHSNVDPVLGPDRADSVIGAVQDLTEAASLTGLTTSLTR